MRTQGQFTSTPWLLAIFGFITTGIAAVAFIGLWNSGNIVMALIFGLIFGIVGLGMLGYGVLSFYSHALLGKPDINLTQTSLPVGGTTLFTLQHTFPREIELENIHLKLMMREVATYKQGTDTRTVTHDHVIDEEEWPSQKYYEGQQIYLQRELAIPRDGMHSFKVTRNEIRWLLQVTIGIPRLPDYSYEFTLDVLPQISVSHL